MPVLLDLPGRPFAAAGFLFDKDGTLLTFAHWRAVMTERARRLSARLSLSETQLQGLLDLMGAGPTGSWGLIPLPRSDAEDAVAGHLAADLQLDRATLAPLVTKVFHEVDQDFPFEDHLRPTAGAEAALREIRRRGGRSAIVTHDIASAARRHLAAVGWTDLVDAVIGLDGARARKPSPEPILAACRALGLSPNTTVMVGDTVSDLLAGRAAGCGLAVGVLTGLGTQEELAPRADLVLPDLASLPLADSERPLGNRKP